MYHQVIDQKNLKIFKLLSQNKLFKDFYLAGGTALALQLGHRQSIDLDWFCAQEFSLVQIKAQLSELGKFKINSEDKGTLHAVLNGVRVSLLFYPYSLLFPKVKFQTGHLADWREIACMKINAISSRGSKKDFIDLYFILKQISLAKLLDLFDKKYKGVNYNRLHILKSLVYFKQADKEPRPIMLEKVSWLNIKKSIQQTVNQCLEI